MRGDTLDAKSLEHQHHDALNICREKDDASFRIHLILKTRGSCMGVVGNRAALVSGRDTHVARSLQCLQSENNPTAAVGGLARMTLFRNLGNSFELSGRRHRCFRDVAFQIETLGRRWTFTQIAPPADADDLGRRFRRYRL